MTARQVGYPSCIDRTGASIWTHHFEKEGTLRHRKLTSRGFFLLLKGEKQEVSRNLRTFLRLPSEEAKEKGLRERRKSRENFRRLSSSPLSTSCGPFIHPRQKKDCEKWSE